MVVEFIQVTLFYFLMFGFSFAYEVQNFCLYSLGMVLKKNVFLMQKYSRTQYFMQAQ